MNHKLDENSTAEGVNLVNTKVPANQKRRVLGDIGNKNRNVTNNNQMDSVNSEVEKMHIRGEKEMFDDYCHQKLADKLSCFYREKKFLSNYLHSVTDSYSMFKISKQNNNTNLTENLLRSNSKKDPNDLNNNESEGQGGDVKMKAAEEPNPNNDVPRAYASKKNMTKSERRELQNKQRALKATSGKGKQKTTTTQKEQKEQKEQKKKRDSKSDDSSKKKKDKNIKKLQDLKISGTSEVFVSDSQMMPSQMAESSTVNRDDPGAISSGFEMDDTVKKFTGQNAVAVVYVENVPMRDQMPQKYKIDRLSHLPMYSRGYNLLYSDNNASEIKIHPEFYTLALKWANRTIVGANARAISFVAAMMTFLEDYRTPSDKAFSRHMEIMLKPILSFLNQSRPLPIGVGNIVKVLKFKMTQFEPDISDELACKCLCDVLKDFLDKRLVSADRAIEVAAVEKIHDNYTILTYSHSSIVRNVLLYAKSVGKKFNVIVLDCKPYFEGKRLLNRLVRSGIECVYGTVTAASYFMKQADLVLLGAHGVFSNGAVMSRIGAAVVAGEAKAVHVPTLFCCETYKFSERGQTDALVYNELDDPDLIISTGVSTGKKLFKDWKSANNVKLLNLVYDVIKPEFVSGLITEIGIIPHSSVSAVNRLKNQYITGESV